MKSWNSQGGRSLEKLKIFDLGSNLMKFHHRYSLAENNNEITMTQTATM